MLAVLVENETAILTLASLRQIVPDVRPFVVYVREPDNAVERYTAEQGPYTSAVLPERSLTALYSLLRSHSSQPTFALRSGVLCLNDYRRQLPPPDVLAKFSYGSAKRLMYLGNKQMEEGYRRVGIETENNRSHAVQFFNLSCPFEPDRRVDIPLPFCFGEDPLITDFLEGVALIRHSQLALRSCFVDFVQVASDPATGLDQAYAYPLDCYAKLASSVSDYLTPDRLEVIYRNGERSRFAAPLRSVTYF